MSDTPSGIQYVTVVCRVCGTRVDERVGKTARTVNCPDCLKPVQIPGIDEIPKKPQARQIPDPGTYRLQPDEPVSATPGNVKRSPRRRSEAAVVLVVCGVCGSRLHPPLRAESYRVRCPDCHRPVRIPSPEEAELLRQQREVPRKPPEAVEPLPVPQASAPPRVSTFYATSSQKIRREAAPELPHWTWFSRVWGFPWQAEVVKKWVFLSLGCSLLGGLGALVAALIAGAGGAASLVMVFFVLPAIWIFLWTASYGAAAWLTVIVDTAAGNVRIPEWPQQGWRDGFLAFLTLVYQWMIAVLVGHCLGIISNFAGGPYWEVMDAAVCLLFPFLVLSMLETNAWYAPLSWPVTRSLGRNFFDWLMCYLLLGASVGGFTLLFGLGLAWNYWLTMVLAGPAWGALTLISARLLGRLAWKITLHDDVEDVLSESP